MADTLADLPLLRLWLAEAEMALHKLMTGSKIASASYDGKSTSFTEANRSDLMMWIGTLKGRIAALDGSRYPHRAPVHLSF